MVIFHCYVSSPEGSLWWPTSFDFSVTKAPSIKKCHQGFTGDLLFWSFLAATGGWLARKLSLIACRMWQCSRSHVLSHDLRKAIVLKGYQSSLCYLCCECPQHLVNLCARGSHLTTVEDAGSNAAVHCAVSTSPRNLEPWTSRKTKEQNSEKYGSRWWLVGISKGYVWSTMKNNAVNYNQTQTIIIYYNVKTRHRTKLRRSWDNPQTNK